MHQALTIINPLPATTLAITPDILDKRDSLVARGEIYKVIADAEAFKIADGINKEIIALDKWIEDERKRLKAPLLAFVDSFDAVFSDARTPLITAKTALGKSVTVYKDAENARILAAHKLQQEEARKAAEEAKRLADEAAAVALAQGANDDVPPPFEEPVVHVPTVLPPAPPRLIKSQSVKTRVNKVLKIDDASLIPRTIGSATLLVPDEKVIKKLLEANMEIPGCRLVDETSIGAKG